MSGFAMQTGSGDRVSAMMDALAHRAIDGSGLATVEGAALGHAWSGTGGEARAGPYRARRNGPILVCDVRLDNRDDLRRALPEAGPEADDPQLILAAHDQWGDEAPMHLDGDFAYALWEPERNRLICARDRFGIKPFYYAHHRADFVAASEPGAVLAALPSVSEPNAAWIADFLTGFTTDEAYTAYERVFALPPGHTLVFANGRINTARYWRLEGKATLEGDPAEQLRELLWTSVSARMAGAAAGVFLSGGLDSSAIAVLAEQTSSEALQAFSLTVPDVPEMDECRYVDAICQSGNYALTRVSGGTYRPFENPDILLREHSAPVPAPGLQALRPVLQAMRRAGLRIVLDGHGGDEVISCGEERLEELGRSGQFLQLWRNSVGAAQLRSSSQVQLFLDYAQQHPALSVVRRFRGRGSRQSTTAWRRIVNTELAERSSLVARVRAAQGGGARGSNSAQDLHRFAALNAATGHGFAVLDRQAARAGLDRRFPFYSRPLVEFCVSLPASEKLKDGWTRAVLRQALSADLPDTVRFRRDKADFKGYLARGMVGSDMAFLRTLFRTSGEKIADYVNMDVLRQNLSELEQSKGKTDIATLLEVWRAAWLTLWLVGQTEARDMANLEGALA